MACAGSDGAARKEKTGRASPLHLHTQKLHQGYGRALAELFESLPEETQAEIAAISALRRVTRDEVLIPESNIPNEVGYILEGTLGLRKRLPDGRLHIIGLLVPTDIYGRIFDGPSNYDVVALTDGEVFAFERAPFEAIMRRVPEIERVFLSSLMDELDAAREWLLLLNGGKVNERVASFLLILYRRHAYPDRDRTSSAKITIPIRRNDLAHYLGMRPESLSRALHELQDMGILALQKTDVVEILDLEALVETSGQNLLFEDNF